LTLSASILPWQGQSWSELQRQIPNLPHAMLFHGTEGIGKVLFAETFAKAALCQVPDAAGRPCNTCLSCGWFSQGNHPDFRQIRPEALEDSPAEGGEGDGESGKSAKASKAPSKEIKIDQIRALGSFINISTHRQGKRIVLLYPAEALNNAAANALLKTLEEPPPDTLFLLVTHRQDRLLPTILSRCRQFSLPLPYRELAQAWLNEQGVANGESWLAQQGGAPLAALKQSQSESREALVDLVRELSRPDMESALRTAEKLQKFPLGQLVACMQRWLYDVFSLKLSGTIRYYPAHRADLARLAERAETPRLMEIIRKLNDRRAVAEHPLSARLFIEDMLLDYVALFSRNVHG
jgi:DNA polymerase-3 subunit delta'